MDSFSPKPPPSPPKAASPPTTPASGRIPRSNPSPASPTSSNNTAAPPASNSPTPAEKPPPPAPGATPNPTAPSRRTNQTAGKPSPPARLPSTKATPPPTPSPSPKSLHLQHQFAAAANRAIHAGYEVIELHAAHGYLLHEFLSPLSNHRTDTYGGPFDNRIRFLLETVREVRKIWNDSRPLFVRLSCTDWADDRGGWTLEDSIALSKRLKAESVDLIDCSSGHLLPPPPAQIPFAPGFQVPFAEAIKREANILTGAVGMITEVNQAASVLAEGQADLVLLAREALRNPNFPLHAARALNAKEKLPGPGQYLRA